MTDNDIIKALESVKQQYGVDCYVCEYKRICRDKICPFHTCDYALALIKRQKAEIEKLRNDVLDTADTLGLLEWRENKIRTEAIKEFAERLKTNTVNVMTVAGYSYDVITRAGIDYLVEKMTEGK